MTDTGFAVTDALAVQRVAKAYVSDVPQPHPLAEGETVSPFEGSIGIAFSPSRIFDAQAFASGGAGMAGAAGGFLRLLGAPRPGGNTPPPHPPGAQKARGHTRGAGPPHP